MKKILSIAFIMITVFLFAGCTGSAGYAKGEPFQLNDNTYALEKIIRTPQSDNSFGKRYGVVLLQEGDTAAVSISGPGVFGNGTMEAKSLLDMTLHGDEKEYTARSISFTKTDEVEGYGSRVVFYFNIPGNPEFPKSATLKGPDEEEITLDLSGLKPQEENSTD